MRAPTLLLAVSLAACASKQVIDLGNARYSVTNVQHAGSVASSRADATEAANDYCSHWQQKAIIESFDDKVGVPPFNSATTSLIFHCAAP